MATQRPTRRSFLISIANGDQKQRTAMRNALCRQDGREILPGLFLVSLTDSEKATLMRRFGYLRVRQE